MRRWPGRMALVVVALAAAGCSGSDGTGRVEVVSGATPSGGSPEASAPAAGEVVAKLPPAPGSGSGASSEDVCAWLPQELAVVLGGTGDPAVDIADGITQCRWSGGVRLVDVPAPDGRAALAYLGRWQDEVEPRETVNDLGDAAVVAMEPDGRTSVAVVGTGGVVILTARSAAGAVVAAAREVWQRVLAGS